MSKLYTLIMAGGRGTRFWPESTTKAPKQYLDLLGTGESLLSKTLTRFDAILEAKDRYIITVKDQEALVNENSKGLIGPNGVIFEPSGRNTAPCILLSLVTLLKNGASKNDVVSIVPSDHVILNEKGFCNVIKDAEKLALDENMIVTIGIPPTFAHTGFGYIESGDEISKEQYRVKSFKEKPDYNTALEYVKSGEYYWNAGMFVSTIEVLLQEFAKHAPEMFQFFDELFDSIGDFKKTAAVYEKLPKISIDYAIMEKSKCVATIPARFDWNDLGSWDALEEVVDKTEDNTIVTSNSHYFDNAKGNIVFTPGKFISLINVDDLIVVSNDTSVVVLPKKDAQKVKEITEYLKDHQLGASLL